MLSGGIPSTEVISSAADREVLDLYSEVMGELMVRGRASDRDHWGLAEGIPGPLGAVDDATLRHLYQAVHEEMMRRQDERPGMWEARDDSADDEDTST